MNPARYARPEVRGLSAYGIHAESGLNLQDNTSLFGPNPALARVLETVDPAALTGYPPIDSAPLREALAASLGLSPNQVCTANGTNELIDLLVRTFAGPGAAVAYHPPSFSMIPTFVTANGARPQPVPLEGPGWDLDAAGFVDAAPSMALVCRPNNPTGNAFPREAVLEVVEGVDGIVVVDEAYVEFTDASLVADLADHPNLVILRTFSKAHGLAGLRVGVALAHPDAVAELAKVRAPFRLNAFSERVAVEALRDPAYVRNAVAVVRRERERLVDALNARGLNAFPSDANFVLFRPPGAAALAGSLRERGVLVRSFGGELAPYLRATVGPPEATEQLLEALDGALEVTA